MRNLKRALSLAVASVMMIGMMVVGTGAVSYADVTSEDNQEAIEVLQTVGIMVGDTDGNFNPDANVTRNEMAVIMSNLMDYNVASYSGTTPFTDVPDWAEPYVAACYTHGITGGTSETTYSGDDPVTTVQAALMLMKALGYFQYQSDFASGWELATISQGSKIDLFVDVEAGVYDAMTRNEVAQLVLNTLESGTVEPDDDSINITSPDGTTIQAGKVNYLYVTSRESYSTAIRDGNVDDYGNASSVNNLRAPIVDLGEKLYRGDLQRTEDTIDDFGRPGTSWRYKTNDIGTYADDPIAVYTAKVSKGELYSLIGRTNVNNLDSKASFGVYGNGQAVSGAAPSDYFASNSSAAAGVSNTDAVAGKGVRTEVYMDNDGNVSIVYINTYVAQANGDYDEATGTLDTITLTNPGSFDVGTLDIEDFDNLADFADEDYILYTASWNGSDYSVESIAKAEVITGEVTAYSQTESVTLDGSKYEYALHIDDNGTNSSKDTQYTVGANASIVVDPYGYVLYVDDASLDVGNYLYVSGIITATGFDDEYSARVYFSDGTRRTVNIDDLYATVPTGYTASLNANGSIDLGTFENSSDNSEIETTLTRTGQALNGWYSYSVSDDEYTLRSADSSQNVTQTHAGSNVNVITSGQVRFMGSITNAPRGDGNTVFLIVDTDGTVNVYTGIKNVPDVVLKSGSVPVYYMCSKDTSTNYASLVIVDASDLSDSQIDIDGATTSVMYVMNLNTTYVDKANGETIYTWNVVLDGEVTTVDTKGDAFNTFTMYYKVEQDSEGYYKAELFQAMAASDPNDEYIYNSLDKSGDEGTWSNGSLSLGGYTYTVSDDTQVVLVLKGSHQVTGGSKTCTQDNDIDAILRDKDAKYEIRTGTGDARFLENALRGYYVTGGFYGVLTDDYTDTDELDVLYVVVDDIDEIPSTP